jgi:hypothetical protein
MEADVATRAYDALSIHARITDLAEIARSVMKDAVESRNGDVNVSRVAELAAKRQVAVADAETPFGNVLDALGQRPADDNARALLRALAAHAIALQPPTTDEERDRAAHDLVWLAKHSPFDAVGLLDRAFGAAAAPLWKAVAAHALGARDVEGKLLEPLVGELSPPPRGIWATAALAFTGVLFVLRFGRLFGRLALSFRKPAEISIAEDGGIRVRWRVELLGRTLGDRTVLVPRVALVRAVREVRYPRLASYAGLLALAIGTYVGIAALADGVRAASPSLVVWGIGIIAIGLALDFGLSVLVPGTTGRCRVVLVSRDGRKLCVGAVDIARADALLTRLARS